MKLVVDIADIKVSNNQDDQIVTYALGSCLGLVVYDSMRKIGGMLHAMLPEGSQKKGEPGFNAMKYVDTGIPRLFKQCYEYGATKKSLKVYAFGCANFNSGSSDMLQIGARNLAILRKVMWKNGVIIEHESVGGSVSRTIELVLATGEIKLKESSPTKVIV